MCYTLVADEEKAISQEDEKYIIATLTKVTKATSWLFLVGGEGILLLSLLPDITESLFTLFVCTIFPPAIYSYTITSIGIRICNKESLSKAASISLRSFPENLRYCPDNNIYL